MGFTNGRGETVEYPDYHEANNPGLLAELAAHTHTVSWNGQKHENILITDIKWMDGPTELPLGTAHIEEQEIKVHYHMMWGRWQTGNYYMQLA